MEELAVGIYRWTAPHPEWRTRIDWGHEVASFALVHGGTLVLVDPLLPHEGSSRLPSLLFELDELVHESRRVEILITIPYHARSAEPLYRRYRDQHPVRIWGHPAVAKRFARRTTPLKKIAGDATGRPVAIADGLATAFAIGNPRRYETPLYLPAHKALAWGDAIVGVGGELRIWGQSETKPGWLEQRFLPTLRPLLELDVEAVLVTHGPPVLKDGRAALRAALAAPPWHEAGD